MSKANYVKAAKDQLSRGLIVVQSAGFRCLAYRDSQRRLRSFWNQKLVPLPVHILDPEV
jgi:hypothetical protein